MQWNNAMESQLKLFASAIH